MKRPKPKDPEIYSMEVVEAHYACVNLQCVRDGLVLPCEGRKGWGSPTVAFAFPFERLYSRY